MDGYERVSVPAVPIPIQPGCHTRSACLGPAGGREETHAWFQTGNIGHLVLEIKHGCQGGRRVQMSKYRDAANSSGWAVMTTGRERTARAGKTED